MKPDVLLKAYPRSWRAEYGEELAGVLAQKRLTPALLFDVLRGAAKEHLRRDPAWRFCAAAGILWIAAIKPLAGWPAFRPFVGLYSLVFFLFPAVASAWTAARRPPGIWDATAASPKVWLASEIGIVLLYLPFLSRQFFTPVDDRGPYFWFFKSSGANLLFSVVLGFAGALLGRLFTPHPRRTA